MALKLSLLFFSTLAFAAEPDTRDAEIANLKRQVQWQEYENTALKLAILTRDYLALKAQIDASKAKLCEIDKIPIAECDLDPEHRTAVRKQKQ